jgi:hypothetical protein
MMYVQVSYQFSKVLHVTRQRFERQARRLIKLLVDRHTIHAIDLLTIQDSCPKK